MDEHPEPFDGLDAGPAEEPPSYHARSSRRWLIGTAVATVVVVGAGVGLSMGGSSGATASQATGSIAEPFSSAGSSVTTPSTGTDGTGLGRMNGYGRSRPGFGASGTSTANGGTATTATAAQQVGVVDIVVTLGYQRAEAAGTGMILTSSGEVLTNNHVVQGATTIKVTVVSTGKTYSASVVGVDASDDIAVVQLKNVSGLQTITTSSAGVSVGASVVGVGNAGGAGGTPSAAAGHVTALDQAITARDEDGSNPERLTGLIESDAPISAGDSGGPLFNSADEVIGMDTAVTPGGSSAAYSIPIATALDIAKKIENGESSATVHVGATAFLGVGLADSSAGAAITSVVSGSPADSAGLQAGDVITAVGSIRIPTALKLTEVIGAASPGDDLTVHWIDGSGQAHHATVTLASGPAR